MASNGSPISRLVHPNDLRMGDEPGLELFEHRPNDGISQFAF